MPGSMLSVSPAYSTVRSPPGFAFWGGLLWFADVSPLPLLLLPPQPAAPARAAAATSAARARQCLNLTSSLLRAFGPARTHGSPLTALCTGSPGHVVVPKDGSQAKPVAQRTRARAGPRPG